MDYDDNDFLGQNHQLACEGCSKVSPVLHPYTHPKFDSDESLHAHLSFNRLAENDCLLSITNQDDNQWIEQYSRGNSDIDFNSSSVKSRRNNVWCDATSLESVEMLPKSVAEDKIMKDTHIKSLDNCNELTEVMDSNLNQHISGSLENVGASNEELKVQENPKPASVDASGLSNNVVSVAAELTVQNEETETAIVKDAQVVSVTEKEDASLRVKSGEMEIEVGQAHEMQNNVISSLVVEKQKKVTPCEMPDPTEQVAITKSAKRSISDTSNDHTTVEADEQPKSPIFGVSLMQEEAEIKIPREENSQDEVLQVESVIASVSKNSTALVETKASYSLDEKVAHGIDVHCMTLVENRDASQIEQKPETNNASQEIGNNSQTFGDAASPTEINADVTRDSSLSSNIIDKVTQGEKNFTFEVNKGAGLGQPGKILQPYPTFEVFNHKISDGPSKYSGSGQLDATKLHEAPISPQNPGGSTSKIGVKQKSERKPRRKSTVKENTKKSNRPKEKTPLMDSVTHFEVIKSHESVAKTGVVFTPIKLPDLNKSTSVFQQPCTENQQLQLRAQILVYGSLISGSAPEESHMIAAFGQSGGGRTWEGVWRACLERLHVQKSRPKSDVTVQPQSANRDDQRIVHPSPQNKVTSSPIVTAANKGAPPTITPMIPLPSSNKLQSKIAHPDYHQPLSPLHLYQNSPMQNISALNSSWLSQGPFAGQWLASGFNTTPHFTPLHVTEPVKLTPLKELGGSGSKHTSNVTVHNSALASSPVPFSNLKGRKRKKATQNVDKVVMTEETLTKVEESKIQSEEANKHAANAASQCNEVWSQLKSQCNYAPDDEVKLVSSAVSIAAAASVAKVAAAAAKIASDIAEQARSMVNVSLSNKSQHLVHPDAIKKAAEMAAEAVVQAGKIVAMSEPMSIKDLVEAGPGSYWKTPRFASKQQSVLAARNLNGTEKKNADSTNEMADKGNLVTKISSSVKDKRKPRVCKGPEMSNSIDVVPESEIALASTSAVGQTAVGQTEPKVSSDTLNECNIEEGCLVEVFKDDDKHNGAWFGAKVLDLKDGKALVSYTDIQSNNGQLTEWVPLEVQGTDVPKIRMAHPVTTMLFEGTRKRRRTASTDFVWSIGDRVDVWIQDRWREGVVTETNKIDVTSLTVQFPGQEETSVVRSWFVRPTLVYKDGKWIECHTSDKRLYSQGDSPQEKRLKLGSPAVLSEKNQASLESVDHVDPRRQEELNLSNHETVFNVGNTTENKKITSKTVKSGLRKEGTGVVFGVPKPGKKQKFMDVSRHYVADVSNKRNTPNDSVKFTKYLIPQAPNSRSNPIEKQAANSKSRLVNSRRLPISTARPLTLPKSLTRENNPTNKTGPDSVIDGENQSGHQDQVIDFSSKYEDELGPSDLVSSLSFPDESKKVVSAKPDRLIKRKFAPTGGSVTKVEKLVPEVMETRRSNRKMQPTSRLLEGLQTSMTISKTPVASNSTPRSLNKVTPKGSTNNA